LPAEINLGNPALSDFYRKASYTFDSSSRSRGQTIFGEPIHFAVTIPQTVNNLDGAISFVGFMLSTTGENILKKQGLNYIDPSIIEGNVEKMPSSLRNVIERR
jgi:molybdate/tungstate transport system substrate-binding protein